MRSMIRSLGCSTVAFATLSFALTPLANAVVVGRAISVDGDLNVANYNHDVDGDMFPNYDVDAALDGPSTGPDSFNIGTAEAPVFSQGSGLPSTLGDMFGIGRQSPDPFGNPLNATPGNPGLPFALVDDSLAALMSDTQGIIKTGDDGLTSGNVIPPDSAPFFGVSDTVNDFTLPTQQASWTFDLSGVTVTSGIEISIDMAAMGDFEPADVFLFEVSLDGGSFAPLFAPVTDDAGTHNYTMQGGAVVTLVDPMTLGGTVLYNEFQTFSSVVSGTPTSLVLRFSATTDGASEAFAFRNVILEASGDVPPDDNADLNGDGIVNLADYTVWRDNLGATGVTPYTTGDANGDGNVTEADYGIWKAQFGTMPGALAALASSQVPEPSGLLLVGLGGVLAIAARRVRS